MIHLSRPRVALFEPRIPQNTGNIARTCAAFNIKLDLIEPLGFSLSDKYLKRAGLDYWEYVDLNVYNNLDEYLNSLNSNSRIIAFTKSGEINVNQFSFINSDILLFGREDNGLPLATINQAHSTVKIPMQQMADFSGKNGVRSLNLSSAVSICTFQALNFLSML